VTKLQIEQLKEKHQQITDMKNDLERHKDQIQQSQQALLDEIEDNLRNIQQSKSPN
jgi:FtsZ-binding cell division protein ZapB